MVKLFVHRYGVEHCSDHRTVKAAIKDAIAELNNDLSYPDRIEVDGKVIWKEINGPFELQNELDELVKKYRD